MKTSDVLAAMEKLVAPLTLSEQFCKKYGAYDNSGIILDSGEQVKGILFCLDLTSAAVKKAKSLGCNLIFTHHPAIFGGIKSVICQPQSPTAALGECMRAGMSVISMHLNFDAAPQGIDYYLMRALGGEKELALLNPLECGGYGRIYNVQPQTFAEFSARAVSQLSTQRARFYDSGRKVERVASFCGAGCDEESIAFAIDGGADTFVSSDMKHHHIATLLNAGLNIVELTHYSAEIYGLARIYDQTNAKLGVVSHFFTEECML